MKLSVRYLLLLFFLVLSGNGHSNIHSYEERMGWALGAFPADATHVPHKALAIKSAPSGAEHYVIKNKATEVEDEDEQGSSKKRPELSKDINSSGGQSSQRYSRFSLASHLSNGRHFFSSSPPRFIVNRVIRI